MIVSKTMLRNCQFLGITFLITVAWLSQKTRLRNRQFFGITFHNRRSNGEGSKCSKPLAFDFSREIPNCVCMYVCMYVYMRSYTGVSHTCRCIHANTHLWLLIALVKSPNCWVYACMYVCMYDEYVTVCTCPSKKRQRTATDWLRLGWLA